MKRRKLLWYLAAAALPLLFLVPVFWWTGRYPLGRNTLVWCDMRQQVMPERSAPFTACGLPGA